MKITESTTIKELIPDGWDFRYSNGWKHANESDDSCVVIYFKKSQKDFAWYIREYLKTEISQWVEDTSTLEESLFDGNYDVPFEFGIGMLKFICDDLGYDALNVFYGLKHKLQESSTANTKFVEKLNRVLEICPEQFLKSIV